MSKAAKKPGLDQTSGLFRGLVVGFVILDAACIVAAVALPFSIRDMTDPQLDCIAFLHDAVWSLSSAIGGLLIGRVS